MSLKQKIMDEIKTSMKARDKDRTNVLRMLLSEIKYAQAAESMSEELPEDKVLKVVMTYHKRLTKSLDDFPDEEKQNTIKAEIKIVDEFMPQRASEEEVKAVIATVLSETEERNFGLLMKQVLAKLGNTADGKMVSSLLKESIS